MRNSMHALTPPPGFENAPFNPQQRNDDSLLAYGSWLGSGIGGRPYVPSSPLGVDMDKNVKEAQKHSGDLGWFYNKVHYGAPWDYKQLGPQYENFGNFHYGVIGTAMGIHPEILKKAAGAAQIGNGVINLVKNHEWTIHPELGTPFTGPPYGDDPKDQYWIQRGIDHYYQIYGNKK